MTVVLDLPDNCGVINISAVFDNPPRGYTFTNWAISPRKVAMITHDGSPTGIWTETPRNNPEEAQPEHADEKLPCTDKGEI